MSIRGLGSCTSLRLLIFVSAAVYASGTNRARAESDEAISPFSNVGGPADSTPSADYVRRQTEPPRFDPDSAAAKEGRARAPDLAPKPLRPKPKAEVGGIVDVDRGADGVMPPSSDSNAASRGPVDDSTPRWPVTA